jgi:hypothetical protein
METEQTQEGVAEEQPKEETSEVVSEAASTEEKATSEKTADDEWKRTMQSRADKAEFALKSAQEKLQELHKEREQQRLEARQKEIAALADEPDEQAKVRRKHQLEDEVNKLQELKEQEAGAVQRKYDQAIELARQHNLSLDDARDLMNAGTPREMELLAELKVAKQAKVQEPPTETKETFPKPDSGTSDAGTDSDEAFLKGWNSGKIPATKENIERAKKIINK